MIISALYMFGLDAESGFWMAGLYGYDDAGIGGVVYTRNATKRRGSLLGIVYYGLSGGLSERDWRWRVFLQ